MYMYMHIQLQYMPITYIHANIMMEYIMVNTYKHQFYMAGQGSVLI